MYAFHHTTLPLYDFCAFHCPAHCGLGDIIFSALHAFLCIAFHCPVHISVQNISFHRIYFTAFCGLLCTAVHFVVLEWETRVERRWHPQITPMCGNVRWCYVMCRNVRHCTAMCGNLHQIHCSLLLLAFQRFSHLWHILEVIFELISGWVLKDVPKLCQPASSLFWAKGRQGSGKVLVW